MVVNVVCVAVLIVVSLLLYWLSVKIERAERRHGRGVGGLDAQP